MCVVFLFFFFFQAEDGIRDIGVTGVQTCALPICSAINGIELRSSRHRPKSSSSLNPSVVQGMAIASPDDALIRGGLSDSRSEERRVGKECRSRWSPYH